MKRALWIDLEYWQPMSGLRYIPACVQEATCKPTSTACTGSSQRLVTSATLEELESRAGNGSMGHGSVGQMGHFLNGLHGSWVSVR